MIATYVLSPADARSHRYRRREFSFWPRRVVRGAPWKAETRFLPFFVVLLLVRLVLLPLKVFPVSVSLQRGLLSANSLARPVLFSGSRTPRGNFARGWSTQLTEPQKYPGEVRPPWKSSPIRIPRPFCTASADTMRKTDLPARSLYANFVVSSGLPRRVHRVPRN